MIWKWLIQDEVRRFVHMVLLVYKLRICKELQVMTSFKVIRLVLFIKTYQDPRDSSLRLSSFASASSWNSYPDPHLGYGQGGYPYSYDAQQPSYQPYYDTRPPPPPQNYDHEPHTSGRVPRQDDKRKLERKYSRIADSYNSIDEEYIHLT
ncbi:unnamed protein product [Vicia faba]|uniref:Uncharacterized protein n=1 Tax=Vicia faba TaxID=3906 RepID=A0AAV0YPU6_VICFA|nr:unnamed protein product [Vicia faba]